jgi:hypothetical protein
MLSMIPMRTSASIAILPLMLAACGDNLPAPVAADPTALTCADYKQLEPVQFGQVQCLIAGHVDSVPGVSYRADNGDTWVQTVYQLGDELGTWGRRDTSHASSCEWFPCIATCDLEAGACP